MRTLFSAVLLSLLAACSCQPNSGMDGGTDAGIDAGKRSDEFDAWREMREMVRQSPDDVPARARALVAAKDAEGLFALVRDDLELLPTTPVDFDSSETAVRWGSRGTLRGEAGTPRERAELLKDLLIEAGFTAEVVAGVPQTGATATGLLSRHPNRDLQFDAGSSQRAEWSKLLARPMPPHKGVVREFDPQDTVRQAILAQLMPLVAAPPAPAAFNPAMARVPLVKATVNGMVRYLNPNLDQAMFGQSLTVDTPEPALPVSGERQLKVTLSAERSANPGVPFTLVEQTWNASAVAGRTVTAAFTAPVSRADASRTRVGDVTSFVPMLIVRGDGLDAGESLSLSVVGKPVTREGALIETGTGGAVVIDGNPLPAGPTPDATLASVSSLAVSASAIAFPQVEVRVIPRKSDNTVVSSLAADAFVVKEDGKNVIASLLSAGATAPKVVLLFDRSTSIPTEFLTGAANVGHSVADALFTQFPGAQVQVVAIDINRPTAAGPLVGTLAQVDAQLSMLTGTGSEVWGALDVVCADPSLSAVVLITDAVADDAPTPAISSRLAAGPPVLVAPVGASDMVTAARLADATHGKLLTGVTATNLAGLVTGFLADRGGEYRIVYRAPAGSTTARQVSVSLRTPGTATASGSYTPPASPVEAGALSALYLTVETDGHVVTRTLAGSKNATAADREAVAGALFGRYILGVEANPPSLSTLLEEHLDEKLALEPGVDALWSGDPQALAVTGKHSNYRVPVELRFFASALPDEQNPDDVSFVDGLTVTLHRQRPVLGVKMLRTIDMLPLVPRRTVSFSGGAVYATTIERTARLAVIEADRFQDNTWVQLKGKTLAKFDPLTVEGALGPAWEGLVYPTYRDYDIYAPPSGIPVAFWAVHKETGEVIGVTPKGGPGEDESTADLVDRLQGLLDAVDRLCEALGFEGVSVWADLESIKVSALGNAIATFEGEPHDDPTTHTANDICNSALGDLGGEIPGVSQSQDARQAIDDINLLGGPPIPNLPDPAAALCAGLTGN